MGDGEGSPLRRAAHAATAPVRGYFNDHFEMVKAEVRRNASGPSLGDDPSAWARVAELESLLAEQSLHGARVTARLAGEVATLTERVAELERLVRQLAAIATATIPDAGDGADAAGDAHAGRPAGVPADVPRR